MRTTPIPEMVGKQQVALVAGHAHFRRGRRSSDGVFICLGLIST
jgi:hypothetical protein